ncbi:MAG: CDP-4-dehydro-6-deoxy-D-glucose 3-dehydratase [Candidatus Woesebacteria bacterium GW2011_GWB1_43_14]|uniref:CDP-4-dehydro-6-deoxy-D-glucose 3-dehydratase n=1 Tax=Candidatus Woesebacteria bacterium GW2011_GWB1_43_14 TaxID=1618578 RepID=A0A0G1GEC5_9BACT|nr:MAG: CDP-4-dehydro-6-deoxy-D-glucose 3-dehydratase [Candidatus Woesebacteria bacterium GW2011_GWA1_39_11b]KKS78364.1 MAG: CDP-4-dehydro-6-deoxy-D-glucose 3-dehydratase [Candidatus Woesebacteria bacterium GW2011_GWC1_42_9]KKS97218.1 MAG: CDP-4-dehydro-6-deoxy-D-glucose 3-dehydratase [Candidatus Woesebacteria bacterium GW2011_GWB1_43_14]
MNMKIPQIEPYIGNEEYRELKSCFDNKWVTEGPKTQEFQKELLKLIGAKYGVFAPNGTLALYLALKAIGVGEGHEVIVPDFTFIASATSVIMAGAKPVFIDVNRKNFQIDVNLAQSLINKRTRAIMPVHMYGTMCEMGPIMDFANTNKLKVIEDAAQAVGVKYRGKHAGTWGDIGCFSFFADKTITIGEGGFIVTNSESVYDKLLYLRNQGRKDRGTFIHPEIGYNFRITDFQSAVGLAQLRKLPRIIQLKKEILSYYLRNLSHIEGVKIFEPFVGYDWIPFRVGIMVDNADMLMEYMESKGIQTRGFFYPLHKQPAFKSIVGYQENDVSFPNSSWGYKSGVCLPTYPTLSKDEIRYICKTIKDFVHSQRSMFYKYYDLMYSEKNYEKETDFVFKVVGLGDSGKTKKIKVLEIGCGTGNHTRKILDRKKVGKLIAIDIDEKMINLAKKKLGGEKKLSIYCSEVSALGEKEFDLALALFNVVTYISKESELEEFFKAIYERLKSGGYFVFDAWNGVAAIKYPPKKKKTIYKISKGFLEVSILPQVNILDQKVDLNYQMRKSFNGAEKKSNYIINQYLWTPNQLRNIYQKVGFEQKAIRSMDEPDHEATKDDWKIIYVLVKRSEK